jgi:hypothetical protein
MVTLRLAGLISPATPVTVMSAGEFGMFAFDIDGDAAPGFNGDSLVFAGITEMTVDGGPHLGTAKWTVQNVTPGTGRPRL